MSNGIYTPEDSLSRHGSSFIYPPIDQPQACTCSLCSPDRLSLELESTLLYQDPQSFGSSYYGSSGFGLWDVKGTTLPDNAGSWDWFRSSIDATTLNANQSLPLLHSGIFSPMYDTTSSISLPTSPTQNAPLMHMFPSSHILPTMNYPHNASPYLPIFGGELVSSTTPTAQDLPPSEAAPLSIHSHSLSVSPGFEKLDTQKQVLDTSVFSCSGNSNPATMRPLPQRKYTSRSQTQDFPEAFIDYGDGYRLDLIKRRVVDIVDEHRVAFPHKKFAQKASFRLEINGYEPYTAQLNVNTTGGPPTKRRFAERTVDFMESFIKKCDQGGAGPFMYKLRLHELVLLRIELVSQGSVQPFFGVV